MGCTEKPQSRNGPISPFWHALLTKLVPSGALTLALAKLFAAYFLVKLHRSHETGSPDSLVNEVGSKIRFPEVSRTGKPSQMN